MITQTELINAIIQGNAPMSKAEMIEEELKEWMNSHARNLMLLGEQYYLNKTKIQEKRATLKIRSNIKREHGFVKKLVDQKVNYLMSLPPTIQAPNEQEGSKQFNGLLSEVFDDDFLRTLKNVGKDAINAGIGWMQPYFDDQALRFKRIPPWEILPLWEDSDHKKLLAILRVYPVTMYEGKTKKHIHRVEFWDKDGVEYYIYDHNKITKDGQKLANLIVDNQPWKWGKVPFVAFKYNNEEQPLVDMIKSLVDDYNLQASKNSDILADLEMITYIVWGYGGEDSESLLKKIKEDMVLFLDDPDGGGKVDKLQVTPDIAAVESTLRQTRQDIIEFGRGVDTQSEKVGTSASGVALKTRFADLDMDCNSIEPEFKASIKELLWFIKHYFRLKGKGNYEKLDVSIILNRDIIIFERDVIENLVKSVGMVSEQTIIENHPFASDDELDRLKNERQQAEEEYSEQIKALGGRDEER